MIGSMRLAAVTAVLVLGCSGAQAHNIGGIHTATGSGSGLTIAAGATATSNGSGNAFIGGGQVFIICAYVRDLDVGVHQFLAWGIDFSLTTWYIDIIDAPSGDEVAYSTVPANTGECNADLTPTTPVPATSFDVIG